MHVRFDANAGGTAGDEHGFVFQLGCEVVVGYDLESGGASISCTLGILVCFRVLG